MLVGVSLNEEDIGRLQAIEKQKVVFNEDVKSLAYTKSLNNHFKNIKTTVLRDNAIAEALADGYTQAQIARHLDISRARVSQMVKKSLEIINI